MIIDRKTILKLVFLAVFSIPLSLVFNVRGLRITITEVLFSIAFLLWIPGIFYSYKDRIELPKLSLPMVFFLITCMVSMINAQNILISIRETLQFIGLFCIYFLIVNSIETREEVHKLLFLLLLGGIAASLLGLYQYLFTHEPIHFRINEFRLRAYSAFGQPNAFGGYLTGLIPISIGLYFFTKKSVLRFAVLISIFIMGLALFATYSRGSWVSLSIGLMIFIRYYENAPSVKHVLFPIVVVLLAAGIILTDVRTQDGRMQDGRTQDGRTQIFSRDSNSQRLLLAKSAIDMTITNPLLGVGIGNYSIQLPHYATKELMDSFLTDYNQIEKKWFINRNKRIDVEIVHNMFLQISAETGLLGLSAFLWLLYAYYKEALWLIRTSSSARGKLLRAGLLGSATAVFGSGIFGWPFSHGVQEILILSMALSTAEQGIEL